jgi:hypothetical protein
MLPRHACCSPQLLQQHAEAAQPSRLHWLPLPLPLLLLLLRQRWLRLHAETSLLPLPPVPLQQQTLPTCLCR